MSELWVWAKDSESAPQDGHGVKALSNRCNRRSGGAGVVYKGTDLTLSRDIAVKALVEQSADPLTLARFLHEARNLASVEHRGLVPVYAVGQENGAIIWS